MPDVISRFFIYCEALNIFLFKTKVCQPRFYKIFFQGLHYKPFQVCNIFKYLVKGKQSLALAICQIM